MMVQKYVLVWFFYQETISMYKKHVKLFLKKNLLVQILKFMDGDKSQ